MVSDYKRYLALPKEPKLARLPAWVWEASTAMGNFRSQKAAPSHRPWIKNAAPFPREAKLTNQVQVVSFQEGLGTLKPAQVGTGASLVLVLGGTLRTAEF